MSSSTVDPAAMPSTVEPAASMVVVQLEPGEDGPVTIDEADRPGAAVLLHSRARRPYAIP